MEQLEEAGIVSSFVNGIGRDVLVTSEEELEELLKVELDF
jgi:hypothetical protein